jgi:hypothetical protein
MLATRTIFNTAILIALLASPCVAQDRPEPLMATVDIPAKDRLLTTRPGESIQSRLYYWNSAPVGDSAQLLTLFCRACNAFEDSERDVPLVSALRDTVGDQAN